MPADRFSPPLFLGAFAALESALAERIFAHKKERGPLAPLQVLVPTHLLGLHLQRVLARCPPLESVHANVRFATLEDFARKQLAPFALRPPQPWGLELLCARLAREVIPRNGYFHAVRETKGFSEALLATFTDLQEALVPPRTFSAKADTPKLKELAAAYVEFCDWLQKHNWHTDASLFAQSPASNLQSPVFLYGFYDLNAAQKAFVERLGPAAVFFPGAKKNEGFSLPLRDWFLARNFHLHTLPPPPPRSLVPSILSAPGEAAEVREALREALAFAREGNRFHDIAILSRNRQPFDPILRDTLAHVGIRAFFRGGRPLIESADAKLLLLLLQAVRSDFHRAIVMELACQIGDHADWDALSVKLGVVGTQSQWAERVLRRNESPKELKEFLRKIFAAFGRLPPRAPWQDYTRRALAAWESLGGKDPAIRAAIGALEALDEVDSPVEFGRFAEFTEKALAQMRLQPEKFQGGGLLVSDVMGARGLSFPLVILLGLTEKVFPRLVREDPLLPDKERARISCNLPLKQRGYEEERLLFELATASAQEKLVLSYSRLDLAMGGPRLPSFLLLESAAVSDSAALEKLPNFRFVPLGQLDRGADALEVGEYDLSRLATMRRVPRALITAMSPLLAAGLEAQSTRWSQKRLTDYDGLVAEAGADLEKMEVSPSRLELLALCPFKYFCTHALGLGRWEEPEAVWEAESDELGKLMHEILRDAFAEWRTAGALPLSAARRDALQEDLLRVAEARLKKFEKEKPVGLPVVWDWQKRTILRDLKRFLDEELKEAETAFVPSEFEYPLAGVPLTVGRNARLRLCGRLDRLDVDEARKRMRIYDYKTGKFYSNRFKRNALAGGETLQLPLYALAVAQQRGLRLEEARYVFLSARGDYKSVPFTGAALEERQADLARVLDVLAALLSRGVFAQYTQGNRCDHCDFRPICGVAVKRLGERKHSDPRLAEFEAMKKEIK